MIEFEKGNILDANTEAIVNTVNTVGIMGKGIALQFKKAFPENYEAYKEACEAKKVKIGKMFIYEPHLACGPRYIINFPTKSHWKAKSRIEDIDSGLEALAQEVILRNISSIAIPPLGCGLGGLRWSEVKPRIEAAVASLKNVNVLVFEPSGAPQAKEMKNRTQKPGMTIGRAAIIGLMNRYKIPGYDYRLSLLEIYKLAYFLQSAGEALRLKYRKGSYGPYADNLRHVLNVMDGHFISGYGDGQNKPDVEISLLDGAAQEAEKFLGDYPETFRRFEKVTGLIEGFETPYGMELLSSVHWVTQEDPAAAQDAEVAIRHIHAWSNRKKRIMKPSHINVSWDRLKEKGWI
ncbi:macro domain-containing protein [bacterium]|nr:macro domain-containing protein [bacterium]